MTRIKNYTNEDVAKAAKESFSIADALRKLNLKPAGGNYACFKKIVDENNIDISHFLGQGHMRGKTHEYKEKRSLESILVEESYYNSSTLRERLIKEGYKKHICECCKKTKWQGNKIPLELDHINGVNTDNRIDNIRLLCPNCHALTPTYRGKNCKKYPPIKNHCIDCEIEIHRTSKRCGKCNVKNMKKKFDITVKELKKLLDDRIPYTTIGEMYGVSDNTVRKKAKKLKLIE